MKTRTAFMALALLGIFCLPAVLPFAGSAPFKIQEFQREFTTSAATSLQAQSPANPLSVLRPDSLITIKETNGSLFENAVAVLQKRYYDERFRKDEIPKLADQYTEKAKRATTLREQREAVHEFLSHIPASHLGLLSKQSYRYVMSDLQGTPYPTFGFQLMNVSGKFYAFFVLEGSPAERAGLLAWDRIVSIDGVPVEQSPRLDWRTDDAYITDDRDPPVHYLSAERGDTIRIKLERQRGKFQELAISASDYSAFMAAKASARIYENDGRKFGYVHFWFVHLTGVPELLKAKLEGEFSSCDGIILDLRGRGGNGTAIAQIINVLRADNSKRHRPIVALVDRQSRSAKDVLAYELKTTGLGRIVGERTAGAVIPATFADVGYETILMFPSFKLPRYTDLLEFKPTEPDMFVERAGPFSAGNDPILKAGLAETLKMVKASAK